MAHVTIPDTSPRVQYTVGGTSTTDFSIPYAYFEDADIVVYVGSTLKALTTDYTITGTAVDEGYSGGTVVLNTGVTNTTVTVIRDVPAERITDFPTNGPFNITQLNSELDRLTAALQQEETSHDLYLKVAEYDTYTDLTLPDFDTRKGKFLYFDSTTGDPEAYQVVGVWQGSDATTTTADYVKFDIVKDSSNSNVYICTADSTTGTLLTNTSYWALLVDAATATSSATAAAASVTAAATSEDNAADSAADAEKLAINAEDSQFTLSDGSTTGYSALHHKEKALDAQTAAEAAQAAAESARDSALSAYDNFDDRYLGVKTSDPTVDNDGDALVAGSLYFNSTDQAMKVYDGSNWYDAYANGSSFLQITNNLSDLNNAATARTNLGLEIGTDVQAYDATIVVDADIGVTVQAYDADTLKADTADTITAPMRGTVTTDNDLSFDMNVTNNFKATPTGTGTLTFTNITAGQSGNIYLDNSGGHVISAAATTFISAADLTKISTAGKYFVSYYSADGTNVLVSASSAVTASGA